MSLLQESNSFHTQRIIPSVLFLRESWTKSRSTRIYIPGKEARQNKGRDSVNPNLYINFRADWKQNTKYKQFPRHCLSTYRIQGYPCSLLIKCYSRCYPKGNTEIPTTPRGKCVCSFFHSPNMPEINSTALEALRSRLKAATIYTPESESYKDVVVRWSDTGMKYAVRKINITNKPTDWWIAGCRSPTHWWVRYLSRTVVGTRA